MVGLVPLKQSQRTANGCFVLVTQKGVQCCVSENPFQLVPETVPIRRLDAKARTCVANDGCSEAMECPQTLKMTGSTFEKMRKDSAHRLDRLNVFE